MENMWCGFNFGIDSHNEQKYVNYMAKTKTKVKTTKKHLLHECSISCAQLFVTLWTEACQDLLSIEFFRQEYWSGLPFPSQWIFPFRGSNPHLLHLLHWQVDSLPLHHLMILSVNKFNALSKQQENLCSETHVQSNYMFIQSNLPSCCISQRAQLGPL